MPWKNAPIPEDLSELKRRLAAWRSEHPRRSRLPEEFWKAAVGLARKHGRYRTARALPIDYANLRKRMERAAEPRETTRSTEFVELLAPPPRADCTVEILRVQIRGGLDWEQILRAWRQAEPR